jgi:hypothetical protein
MLNLHQQLAEAQAALRDAEDTYKLIKVITEQRAIDAVSGSYGKNADERERFLILALAGDTNYARALVRLRRAEQAVDQLKAALATQEDDRRAYEWSVRAALVEALGQRREPFDAAMDEAAENDLLAACRNLIKWYDQEETERTEWVGVCEFEALLQDDDDGLADIVEQARTAVTQRGQRRPQPNYSALADDVEVPDDWYKHD